MISAFEHFLNGNCALQMSISLLLHDFCIPSFQLYVTFDFCKSWDLVHDYVNPRFFWGVPGYDQDMNVIHMEVLDPVRSK